jgi:hypothetical protein
MKIRKSEPIQLVARTHGYFPASFRWRGRRFEVLAVEKCWTQSGRTMQRTFRVRCQAGRFVLEQNVTSDSWQVTHWPLALWWPRVRRPAPARFPLPRHQRRPAIKSRGGAATPAQVIAHATPPAHQVRGDSPRVEGSPTRRHRLIPAQVTASAPLPGRNRQWTVIRPRW